MRLCHRTKHRMERRYDLGDFWLTWGVLLVYAKGVKELLVVGERSSAQKTLNALRLSDRLKGWKTGATDLDELQDRDSLPDLTVVDVPWPLSDRALKLFAHTLAEKQDSSRAASFLILNFHWPKGPEKPAVVRFLRHFRRPECIQVYLSPKREVLKAAVDAIGPTIDLLRSSVTKEASEREQLPQPSMLDKMQKVLDVTKDLRSDSGKLSAKLIADLYKVPQTDLANWLGKKKQGISKTPDADSLQKSLEYFERIARLRIALSDEDFRKWLRMRNELLDGATPLELIAQGKLQLVVDFVADMITGSPT